MKCKDCGKSPYEPSCRADICVECMELRTDFMRFAATGAIDPDEFRQVQIVIASGRGQGANVMRRVMGLGAEL